MSWYASRGVQVPNYYTRRKDGINGRTLGQGYGDIKTGKVRDREE